MLALSLEMCLMEETTAQEFYDLVKPVLDQQREMPRLVDERMYVASSTAITLRPQSKNTQKITSLFIQVTSNATLQLGDRTFIIDASLSPYMLTGQCFILYANDNRVLTQQATGFMSLELMGEELGDTGRW